MKALLAISLAMTLAVPAFGGRRRAVAVSPAAPDELKLVFVGVPGGGSEGLVEAGAMSRARSVTRRVFGIRIESAHGSEGATAALRAYLESHDGRSTIRIDGIEIDTIPKLIDAQSPIGIVTTHTIEIEVPGTVPEGAFASTVRWEAGTQ